MRPVLLAMMTFSVGCATEAAVRKPEPAPERHSIAAQTPAVVAPIGPREPAKPTELSIDFVGNVALPSPVLLNVMWVANPALFETPGVDFDEVLERDVLLLNALYYDRGYVAVKIEPPEVTKAGGRPVSVRIHVNEGARFTLGKLDLVELGDNGKEVKPLVPKQKLLSNVALQRGGFFARNVMAEGIQRIALRYRDAGYAYAEVLPRTEVHPDTSEIDMVIEIRRGPLVHVAKIEVIGNLRVDPKKIRDHIEIAQGQLFNETKLDASRKSLLDSGYFDRVDCSTEKSTDGIIVRFELVER